MMDSPKTGNGLPVIGPGTDIGVSSPHIVGYLGKNYDSANILSDGYCPACREKGKLKTLKTYRISFQESVYLCEDLQCIYPLGSKSFNNLISPDLEDLAPNKPQKRKLLEISSKDSPSLATSKKIKSDTVIDGEQVLNSKHNGEAYEETSSDLPDSLHSGQQSPVKAADFLGPDEILEAAVTDLAAEEDATAVDISKTGETALHNEGGTSELEMPLENRCIPFCQTSCVQWKNSDALCWLDCLLSLLVHLEVVKKAVMTDLCSKEESLFWQLFAKYNQASKLLHASHLDAVKDRDYTKLISVFAEIETCLNDVRSKIFIRLQPQLGCTLGDMESPVIAFPLLLRIEACIEKLFTYSFSWNFECSQCGHKYQNGCMKNLVTFTDLVPEWHPLNAAHFGPCSNCNNKSQIRKMVLKKVSPIFMLHFVEGLPHNDLQHYSFLFEGYLYQITSVIQYYSNNHFITWILCVDGSWLECDDLKGPCCKRYKKFEVPASEIHIVIWERKTAQMTDKASACLSLQKTNDQHAFSDEKQPPPALRFMGDASSAEIPSGTYPPNTSVTTNTLSQDKAVVHQPHLLSVPKGLIGNDITPLSLEKVQVNSEGCLLENIPVAENGVVIKTNTLQQQESLMASLVSAPCKEKFTQDQFVDLSFPSPIVSTNMQSVQPNSENTIITNSVTNIHATGPIQGVKSVEIEDKVALEKDVPFNHFLSPKTEKLKIEQHITPQVSNLERKFSQTIAESSQNPSLKENLKKPFMGSWVKGLLSKGASFLPPCVSAHNINAITDLQHSVKGARNFGGYKTKGVKQKAHRAPKKPHRCASKPSPASNLPPSLPSSGSMAPPHADVNADLEVLKKHENASYGVHLNHRSGGNENGVSLANHEDSVEGQIHKLRLKLLKKLKAKKKKLAALMSSPLHGKLPSENLEHVSHCGSPNDGQSIEDVLKELQYQIDIADNKSGRTTFASVSPYSDQTHEEILAELLSPTTVCSELSENREADFRYLEMGDNHIPAPVPSELNGIPNTLLRQDHNYCSPAKKNLCQVQPDPLTNNECDRTLNLESSLKTDVFDEFFSTSALNSLANDTLDLPFFDDYLFESC
ncbi:PREDICTED: SUMO-specific isopeptidase USPL1 [Myotis davidii]|uniref:Ubiquitin-specific peptidase-like protein 1 n=1 Tax=Myotis davidii TaxID=225400 RepID=L5LXR9_MYODS|nr:PREDICTED: SUMO-specific isopeptidase USPL1 [Myotis davidii]XP_015419376.1 PREDICTED: SUMO-specific isopeptidase USPL1 [Myotis davidii]XP_015419377.1 PREDICTED: SUMO-specific isopeptidase USPL1 [Myotis davidii]ELK30263.1 Ubiquitin-specific peptidase-like protein 1 [Myotis davidii]